MRKFLATAVIPLGFCIACYLHALYCDLWIAILDPIFQSIPDSWIIIFFFLFAFASFAFMIFHYVFIAALYPVYLVTRLTYRISEFILPDETNTRYQNWALGFIAFSIIFLFIFYRVFDYFPHLFACFNSAFCFGPFLLHAEVALYKSKPN